MTFTDPPGALLGGRAPSRIKYQQSGRPWNKRAPRRAVGFLRYFCRNLSRGFCSGPFFSRMGAMNKPLVAVIMGSKSDWETMQHADAVLTQFGVPHECRVVSAHRTPAWMAKYASGAA